MGERKVLNKYYPPDFDPSKLPRVRVGQKKRQQQMKARNMLPASIRCKTCGHYMGKGTKVNSRKEKAVGEVYLGIPIFRFCFKCSNCHAELAIKTDPRNSGYVVELGASQNFEQCRDQEEEEQEEQEEIGDSIKLLEKRSQNSKREMEIMDRLDELKFMKPRHDAVSTVDMLEALQRTAKDEREKKLEEKYEALVRSTFPPRRKVAIRRISDEEEFSDDDDSGGGKESSTRDSKKR